MLLLSAIASAETRRARTECLDSHVQYASYLMQQGSVGILAEEAFPCGTPEALKLELPVRLRAQAVTVWAMKPPSAQGTEVQEFTGNRV